MTKYNKAREIKPAEKIEETSKYYKTAIKDKTLIKEVVYNDDLFKKFIKELDGYMGPFTKSIFISRDYLIRKSKELGFPIKRSKLRGNQYFVTLPLKERKFVVKFDSERIDEVPKEKEEKS